MTWQPPLPDDNTDDRPSQRGEPKSPPLPQPALDKPLFWGITPSEIYESCIESFETAWTSFESSVDPDLVVSETVARNERTGNVCRLVEEAWTEEDRSDPSSSREFMTMFTVELKLGIAMINATWTCSADEGDAAREYLRTAAENTFIKMSALIGKRVRRGIIVG